MTDGDCDVMNNYIKKYAGVLMELLTLLDHLPSPSVFCGVRVVYLSSFMCCIFCFVCLRCVSCAQPLSLHCSFLIITPSDFYTVYFAFNSRFIWIVLMCTRYNIM
jgi:hypothetical protein